MRPPAAWQILNGPRNPSAVCLLLPIRSALRLSRPDSAQAPKRPAAASRAYRPGSGWVDLSGNIKNSPLTCFYKNDLLLYAKKNGLEWREDSTNSSDLYLRNRLRKRIKTLNPSIKQNLIQIWRNQTKIARDINKETAKFSKNSH